MAGLLTAAHEQTADEGSDGKLGWRRWITRLEEVGGSRYRATIQVALGWTIKNKAAAAAATTTIVSAIPRHHSRRPTKKYYLRELICAQ